MISKDTRTVVLTQKMAEPEEARLDGSSQHAGTIKITNAASLLRAEVPDLSPEWKSVRLDPRVSEIMESMTDPVVAHDFGVIVGFNERVPELLGCPAEKLLWRRLSKFIEPVSLPTLTRWIKASDHYAILVNGVRACGNTLLLRLEAVASLAYPGGGGVEIVSLVEFGAEVRLAEAREASSVPRPQRAI
jgi:PAS domain-containing protein